MSYEGLSDDTLIELLVENMPQPGFHLFKDLDQFTGFPAGTWARLGKIAAQKVDRFESCTTEGIRIGNYRIISRR